MEKLEAIVESIVYRSDDTGYTVAEISVGNALRTAVGTVPQLAEGTKVLMEGDWVNHPVYGEQFKISALKVQAPDTLEGVMRYLASGVVPGVGPVTAQRIVDTFGMETLEVIRYQPGRLTEVEGIGASRAEAIAEGFAAHYDM
jgi:exodeoxyribonuclease V alpha subunit